MAVSGLFLALAASAVLVSAAGAGSPSDKRGLCFVPNDDTPQDNTIWTQPGSTLGWYYNYESTPSPSFAHISQDDFEFIPMMWGAGPNFEDTAFLDQVRSMIEDDGRDIRRVLGFNEPDAGSDVGGSNLLPADAATAWVANFEPLAEMGVELGLPACTGGWGSLPWLEQFLGNCSALLSTENEKRNCTWDFLPVHWYDNIEGLYSHIGERLAKWPNASIWITEFAYANQDLTTTQEYFNQSLEYFDTDDSIGGYTYFGAFRSAVSNVGPNAVFLNNDGDLTDLGSWYLGFGATGVDPQSGSESSAPVLEKGMQKVIAVMLAASVMLAHF